MHPSRSPGTGRRRRLAVGALSAVAAVVASTTVGLTTPASSALQAAKPTSPPAASVDLGPNVTVFDPSMPVAQIQAAMDATHAQQVDNEMGQERYAFLFKPGTYGTDEDPLQVKVGYYTEVAGLGASPTDVVINGKVEVYNRCLGPDNTNCIALNNFWRTISNLTIDVNGAGQDGCRAARNFWAVSQAVSMRRLNVTGGDVTLMDYCTAGPQYASGGFIADSRFPGEVINGSQQQWLTRNSEVGTWSNGVWNQVFSGVVGAPSEATFPNPPYTTLDTTSVSREKPYLFVDAAGRYQVRVPSARRNTRGVSWGAGTTPGRTVPLSDFAVLEPSDSVSDINRAVSKRKHLLFTPGHYEVDRTIRIKRADTVVLGIGHATLNARDGATPMEIADESGIVVAGITIEAGAVESDHLMVVGDARGGRKGHRRGHHGSGRIDPRNPITLSDVYFRVGGSQIGKVDVALEVNADHTLIDHTWVWRADHGIEGFGEAAEGDTDRWATIIGRNGVVVNGDDVTATGLFVEHFQEYNTIWNGERGRVTLYQNELPYDPPTQADWMNGTVEGWAGYKVADHVRSHRLYGGGVYVFNQNNPSIHTENGFEVPVTPDVRLHHIMTVNLAAGTIDHVVNGVGTPADNSNTGTPQFVVDYPAVP